MCGSCFTALIEQFRNFPEAGSVSVHFWSILGFWEEPKILINPQVYPRTCVGQCYSLITKLEEMNALCYCELGHMSLFENDKTDD